ncbi:MAG: hypothetical protein ABGW78_01080 [Pirellulales bacterium]
MKRSRETEGGSSLELLLDTITNTFGSILFITILVALLLRLSSTVSGITEPISQAQQARDEAKINELTEEIQRLRTILEKMPVNDPSIEAIEREIASTTLEIAKALHKQTEKASETVARQEQIIDIEKALEQIKKDLKTMEPLAEEQAKQRKQLEERSIELAKLAVELDRPVDPKTINLSATLPELVTSEKKQFGLFMRYGRIYQMHIYSDTGKRLGPNEQDFFITVRSDGTQVAKAKPNAGIIADSSTIKDTIANLLRPFPSTDWVIAVVVNKDSFGQFQTVKSALVELGYQYEPFGLLHDEGVWDRGGTAKGQ